jgi:hypothetical protein
MLGLFEQPVDGLLNVLGQPEQVVDAANTDPLIMDACRGVGDSAALHENGCLGEHGREERLARRSEKRARPPRGLSLFTQQTNRQSEQRY